VERNKKQKKPPHPTHKKPKGKRIGCMKF
jgi:hypothetical protein